ncbi:MAG: hypothetical protein HY541_08040, partial [Deltaproteobacteria bacterium]|nr:hypothetical protein [Deltaproteobacteria bacterium]
MIDPLSLRYIDASRQVGTPETAETSAPQITGERRYPAEELGKIVAGTAQDNIGPESMDLALQLDRTLPTQIGEAQNRGDFIEAARLTHRLYWAFVRAALDHEIGEALEGRLNDSVRPMDRAFKERLDELRKLANTTLHSVQERNRTPETKRASTFLARAFRRMLISDTRDAVSPLEKIMDEGTLI